jgi:hypothetical protein
MKLHAGDFFAPQLQCLNSLDFVFASKICVKGLQDTCVFIHCFLDFENVLRRVHSTVGASFQLVDLRIVFGNARVKFVQGQIDTFLCLYDLRLMARHALHLIV